MSGIFVEQRRRKRNDSSMPGNDLPQKTIMVQADEVENSNDYCGVVSGSCV